MIRWIVSLWYARLRKIDVQILWPVCLKYADDLDHAKATFFLHAIDDPAWINLGGEEAILSTIDAMTVRT